MHGAKVHVKIVTNAMPGWVEACAFRYYPDTVYKMLLESGARKPFMIEVVSAREVYFTKKVSVDRTRC